MVIVCHVVIPTVKIKIAAHKASAEPNVFQQEPVFPEKMPQPRSSPFEVLAQHSIDGIVSSWQ